MSNYVQQLETLKEKAQKKKEEKIRLEEKIKSLEEQIKKQNEELQSLEVKPEDLEKTIKELTTSLDTELKNLSELLNV